VRDVAAHLKQRCSRLPLPRVGVAELAAAAHIPRGYLNRLFREIFGLSASVALEHLRCFRAEVLLTRTDLTIAAIAHQRLRRCHSFSHRFGDLYGIPPSRYRMVPNQSPSVLDEPGVPG
jgi:AraC family transcriptional regulator